MKLRILLLSGDSCKIYPAVVEHSMVRFIKVSPNSWAQMGRGEDAPQSYGSNQGLVVGEGVSLVVDTGFHETTARSILEKIGKKQRERIVVINTHYHSDHVFGNYVYASIGSIIVAHERCRRLMLRFSPRLLTAYRSRNPQMKRLLKDVEVSVPNVTYSDRLSTHLDNVQADLIHPEGTAHTDGDTMVFVPRDRVLYAGDVLWVGYHPNLEDANIQGQISALRMILRLKPRKIVPGHGPVCGLGEVKRFIRYLEEFEENSREGLKENLTGDRLVRRVIPPWSWNWKMRWLMESYVKNLPRKNG